jgi:hypothetical protein
MARQSTRNATKTAGRPKPLPTKQQTAAMNRKKKAAEDKKRRATAAAATAAAAAAAAVTSPVRRRTVLSDLSDVDSSVTDTAPQYVLWKSIPATEHVIVSKPGGKASRVLVREALKIFKKIKNPCTSCDAHPHCGPVGHDADMCNALDPDSKQEACPACLDPILPTHDAIMCVRCGILVCGQCATVEAGQELCAICVKCPVPSAVPKPTRVPVGAGVGLASPDVGPSSTQLVDPSSSVMSLMSQSQPVPAGPAPYTMTAQTGEADDSCISGLRGMTDPKVRLDRPVMPCDMLVANTAAGQMHESADDALVVGADGKIKTKKSTKSRQCNSSLEWGACNIRLLAYMVRVGTLTPDQVNHYHSYSLKIMDLMQKKQFSAVMEYDWLCRLAVWRATATWLSPFYSQYEVAFTDKTNGACLTDGAKYCNFCQTDTHAPGESESCIFRSPDLASGNPTGGAPHKPKPALTDKDKQNQAAAAARAAAIPAGDTLEPNGKFWKSLDGKKLCAGFNMHRGCTKPSCKFVHRCSNCKESGHSGKNCRKPLAT